MIVQYRTPLRILLYALIFTLSLLFSLALKYDFKFLVQRPNAPDEFWLATQFLPALPLILIIKLAVFGLFGLYRSSLRYVGFRDILYIIVASYISTFVFIVSFFLTEYVFTFLPTSAPEGHAFGSFPQVAFLLDLVTTIGLACVVSIGVRFYHEEYLPADEAGTSRLLIVGAGDAGETLLREIQRMDVVRYEVVGFLDDEPQKQRTSIHGVRVIGRTPEVREVCKRFEVEEVLIAMPSAPQRTVRALVERCHGMNVHFRTVPALSDLIAGRVKVSQIRDVDIEDVLGREAVTLDTEAIGRYVCDKAVVVTGAGGSIGSEMCRQIARFGPKKLILLEHAENNLFTIEQELRRQFGNIPLGVYVADIADATRIDQLFAADRPNAVFHAAAHKHVPMMERNVGEAVKNNIGGTRTLADAAMRHHVEKFVMISTDKAVNPTSVMGCSKRVAEMYVQQLSGRGETQFVTVRFGNVLGSSGSVVPIFRAQIARGGPVTVTHPEMVRYFMTIPEAAQLVLQAGAIGAGGEILLLDMGEPVKIVDLARDLITLSGLRPDDDVEIQFTGVRPGEKLFEELSISGEDVQATSHAKIGVWRKRPEDWDTVCGGLEDLLKMADAATPDEIRERLRRLVPEYQPNGNGDDAKAAPKPAQIQASDEEQADERMPAPAPNPKPA